MYYEELADELLRKMQVLQRAKPQKNLADAVQGEAFVLRYIAHHGSSVLPGEIGQKMEVSSARVAVTLNNLEKKGLITRQIDRKDRRKILVEITQDGKDFAEQHQKFVLEIAANMLRLLGEEDAKEYVRITGRLADMLPDHKGCR